MDRRQASTRDGGAVLEASLRRAWSSTALNNF
jgi:hypothetical protein